MNMGKLISSKWTGATLDILNLGLLALYFWTGGSSFGYGVSLFYWGLRSYTIFIDNKQLALRDELIEKYSEYIKKYDI